MSWGEVKYGDEIRKVQKKRLKHKIKSVQKTNSELIEKLQEEQMKILGREAVLRPPPK